MNTVPQHKLSSPVIVFMGTPEFALPSLRALHKKFGVAAVVTAPDKPRGRGLQLLPPPVKEEALRLQIPYIFQPRSLRDKVFQEQLAALHPDIIAVVAFRILPPAVYNSARIAAFNVHASLLPAYRGAAPIHWVIIRGEKKTGVTSFLLQETVDTGPILVQKEIEIPEGCTAGELHDLLAPLAAEVAVQTVQQLLDGTAKPIPQPEGDFPLAPKLRPEDCWIKWNQPAETVCRWIRGLSPVPGARTILDGMIMKIFRCAVIAEPAYHLAPGEYFITDSQFLVGCGDGKLIAITELQLQGRKRLSVTEFVKGYRGMKKGHFYEYSG